MAQHLLTLGIPTCNRKSALQQLLTSISRETCCDKVAVYISDNASSDGTREMVNTIQHTLPGLLITYHRHTVNRGFDANILHLYKRSRTPYIWFLSDDDKLIAGSICRVIESLEKYQPGALYVNQITTEGKQVVVDGDMLDMVPYLPTGYTMKVCTDRIMQIDSDLERLIASRLLSFISTCLVKRDEDIMPSLESYIGTGIAQDAIVSLILKKNPRLTILGRPCIRGSAKKSISQWFLDSTLFGVDRLYHNPQLTYPTILADKTGLHNCAYGLVTIALQKVLGIPIEQTLSLQMIRRILTTYRFRSVYLAPFIVISIAGLILPERIVTSVYNALNRYRRR